ncbi:MAG: hypothetical protein AAB533_00550 [Patescibacteria group bacterium]
MTVKSIARAIRQKKPAIIKENGSPRYVVLDWETYRSYEEMREDTEDSARLARALADPKNQKRIPYARVKNSSASHDRSFPPSHSACGNPRRITASHHKL